MRAYTLGLASEALQAEGAARVPAWGQEADGVAAQ